MEKEIRRLKTLIYQSMNKNDIEDAISLLNKITTKL